MSKIYCGNNRLHPSLKNGSVKLGKRYPCFKKGIGTGLNSPLDKNYNSKYSPIDKTKIYCGKSRTKPPGYDRMGNLSECLRKGVGVGKKIKAEKSRRKSPRKKSRRKSPRKKSRRKSPRKKSRRKSPRKKSRRKSPRKKHRSPKRRSKSSRMESINDLANYFDDEPASLKDAYVKEMKKFFKEEHGLNMEIRNFRQTYLRLFRFTLAKNDVAAYKHSTIITQAIENFYATDIHYDTDIDDEDTPFGVVDMNNYFDMGTFFLVAVHVNHDFRAKYHSENPEALRGLPARDFMPLGRGPTWDIYKGWQGMGLLARYLHNYFMDMSLKDHRFIDNFLLYYMNNL